MFKYGFKEIIVQSGWVDQSLKAAYPEIFNNVKTRGKQVTIIVDTPDTWFKFKIQTVPEPSTVLQSNVPINLTFDDVIIKSGDGFMMIDQLDVYDLLITGNGSGNVVARVFIQGV